MLVPEMKVVKYLALIALVVILVQMKVLVYDVREKVYDP